MKNASDPMASHAELDQMMKNATDGIIKKKQNKRA
jgi:hypothetical protein